MAALLITDELFELRESLGETVPEAPPEAVESKAVRSRGAKRQGTG